MRRLFPVGKVPIFLAFIFITIVFESKASWSLGNYNGQSGRPKDSGLKVRVIGLKPQKGILRLALYSSVKSYDARREPVRSVRVPVLSANVTVEFPDLPEGWYAIMFYHDANDNGKFDTILGLPKEQFGFSNNAVPGLSGPPSFEKVKFFVPKGKRLVLTLKAQ